MKSKLAVVTSVNGYPRISNDRYAFQNTSVQDNRGTDIEINASADHLQRFLLLLPGAGNQCALLRLQRTAISLRMEVRAMSPPIVTWAVNGTRISQALHRSECERCLGSRGQQEPDTHSFAQSLFLRASLLIAAELSRSPVSSAVSPNPPAASAVASTSSEVEPTSAISGNHGPAPNRWKQTPSQNHVSSNL